MNLRRLVLAAAVCLLQTAHADEKSAVAHWDVEGLKSVAKDEGHTFEVGSNWVTEHLRKGGSLEAITGLKRPSSWMKGAKFVDVDVMQVAELPAKFDWRTEAKGGLNPVRNQGNCGSCWAFSILGVLEALVKIKDPTATPDYAEQTMVSTCEAPGDCGGGYFTAFNFVAKPGIPDEKQDPYQARNTRCKSGLKPVQKIAKWSYIGNGRQSPTTEQIKAAIYKYGPVAVDVNGSFGSYSKGIYNRCNTGGTNHMVVLVGWNDEEQTWIMRNSWGKGWGEDGHMRIKYTNSRGQKCNNIGSVAAFATLE